MGQIQSKVVDKITPHVQNFDALKFISGTIPTNENNNSNNANAVSIIDEISDKLLQKHFTQLESYSLRTFFDNRCKLNESTNTLYIDEKTFMVKQILINLLLLLIHSLFMLKMFLFFNFYLGIFKYSQ